MLSIFHVPVGHLYAFFGEMSRYVFCPFFLNCVVCFVIECMSCLYTLFFFFVCLFVLVLINFIYIINRIQRSSTFLGKKNIAPPLR